MTIYPVHPPGKRPEDPMLALILLLALQPSIGHGQALGPPLMAYRTGNPRIAMEAAGRLLERDPDSADAFAVMGMSLAGMGSFADAAPCFTFALGSELLEADGLNDRADTLRALGRPAEAAALRAEALPLMGEGTLALRTGLELVDDLRTAGALGEALDAAEALIGAWPYSAAAHAAHAQVLIDLGRDDEADFALWLANRRASLSRQSVEAAIRLNLRHGDIDAAWAEVTQERLPMRAAASTVALRAELLRLRGEPEEALALLDAPRFRYPDHPLFLAARARALLALGEVDQAREVARQARALYPAHPDVVETLRADALR